MDHAARNNFSRGVIPIAVVFSRLLAEDDLSDRPLRPIHTYNSAAGGWS